MFDAAPTADPIPLQQSDAFERTLRALGQAVQRLEDGTLAVERSFGPLPVHMMSRTQAGSPEALLTAAKSLASRGPVILSPNMPLSLDRIGALPLVSPNTVARLDLRPGLAALTANMHQKWRNRLRHAQRQDLRVKRQNMPDDPAHWLLQADALQQSQRRYRSWPTALTLAYGRENPSQSKLFTAFWGREPVAAMLILRHGTTATYHIGHARPSGRIASAHTLLMWEVISWARKKGIDHLELGMIDTEEGQGLARFKLGTGAQAHRLGGTWVWWPPMSRLFTPIARLDRRLMCST